MTQLMDIDVLREMIRIAEGRRVEMLETLERINKYNLAIVAFSASFLSLLVTATFDVLIVQCAGIPLLLSIFVSLFAVRPKAIHGASLVIDEDVEILKKGTHLDYREYLLLVAELTDAAGSHLNKRTSEKKRLTIFSAILLALALITTYSLYAYA